LIKKASLLKINFNSFENWFL